MLRRLAMVFSPRFTASSRPSVSPLGSAKSRASIEPDRSMAIIRSRPDFSCSIGGPIHCGLAAASTRHSQVRPTRKSWALFRRRIMAPVSGRCSLSSTNLSKKGTRTESRLSLYAGSKRMTSGSASRTRAQGCTSSNMSRVLVFAHPGKTGVYHLLPMCGCYSLASVGAQCQQLALLRGERGRCALPIEEVHPSLAR